MEKVQYHVWKAEGEGRDQFKDKVLSLLPGRLGAAGVLAARAAIYDDLAAQGKSVRQQSTMSQPDAVVSVWMNTANDFFRSASDAAVASVVERMHAYLVVESEPVPNEKPKAAPGERLDGINQIVFLRKPDRLAYGEWLSIWHNSHSFVGIGTQSIFAYRQNTVVRPLTYAAPHYDAFIEECFPEESIDDLSHYYDGRGEKSAEWDHLIDKYFPEAVKIREENESRPRWKVNGRIMLASCKRFIDMGQEPHVAPKIDCTPYSEYGLA